MKQVAIKLLFRFGWIGLIFLELSPAAAQSGSASFSEIMSDLIRIQQNFQPAKGSFVSCSMSYLYSKEKSPTKYLDSLTGAYKASGNSFYAKLGNTETIQNDSMLLAVYNDDKAMMASPASQRKNNDRRLFLNSIDSAFVVKNVTSATITQSGEMKTMTFHFTDSSRYYNCILIYDAVTYVPQTISYILSDSKIAESGQPPAEGGVITIRFRNFSKSAFNTSVFNVSKYVNAKGNVKGRLQSVYNGYSLYQSGDIRKATD